MIGLWCYTAISIVILVFSSSFIKAKNIWILIFLLVFIVGMIRELGPDYFTYLYIFANFKNLFFEAFNQFHVEPFWVLLGSISILLGLNAPLVFAVSATLSALLRYMALNKFLNNRIDVANGFLFYITFDFFVRDNGQIRNGLAASLFVLMFVLTVKNQKRMTAWALSLPLFHYAYLLPGLFLLFVKRISVATIIIFGLALVSLSQAFFFQILSIVPEHNFFQKLESYGLSYNHSSTLANPVTLYLSLAAILHIWLRPKTGFHELVYIGKALLVGVIGFFVFYESPIIKARFLTMFTPLLMLWWPWFLRDLDQNFGFRYLFRLVGMFLLLAMSIYAMFRLVVRYSPQTLVN